MTIEMTISKSFWEGKEKLAHLRALALLELPVDIDSVVVDVDMVNQGLDDGDLSLIIQRVDLSGRQGVFAEGFDPLGISTCFGAELSSEGVGLCFEFFRTVMELVHVQLITQEIEVNEFVLLALDFGQLGLDRLLVDDWRS